MRQEWYGSNWTVCLKFRLVLVSVTLSSLLFDLILTCRYILLSACWDESPEIRPCFANLVDSFRNITTNWRSSMVSDMSKMEDDDELRLSYEQLYSDFSGDSDNSMAVMLDSLGGGKVQEVVFRKEDAVRECGNSDGSSGHYSHLAPVEDARVCATNLYYNIKQGEQAGEPGSQLHPPPVPPGVPRAYSSRENSCPSTPQICPHSPHNSCHCCSFEHSLETSTSSGTKSVKTSGEHSSFEDSTTTLESNLSGRKSAPIGSTTDCQPRKHHTMNLWPSHSVVSSNPGEVMASGKPKSHSLPRQTMPYLTPLKLNKPREQYMPDEEDERMTHLPQHHYFVLEQPPSKQIALLS